MNSSLVYLLFFIGAAIGLVFIVLRYRAKSMNALAQRLGFEFTADGSLPEEFCMTCNPFDQAPLVWNVLDTTHNGLRILIFDSVVGRSYRTVVAVHSEASAVFDVLSLFPGEILQSNGWTALIKKPSMIWGLWGFNTSRIEEVIDYLRI